MQPSRLHWDPVIGMGCKVLYRLVVNGVATELQRELQRQLGAVAELQREL